MCCLWDQKSQICKNVVSASDGEWNNQKTKKVKKLVSPSERAGKTGGDVFDSVVGTAADAFVEHALPWMGHKAVEMGRYGASELMRNKKTTKKAVKYGIDKLTPFIQDSFCTAMDQLSTKVRPKKKYPPAAQLNRKVITAIGGGVNPTLQYAFDEAKIAGYQGNIDQFAKTTGLTHKLTGGNLVFDAVKLGWDKVAKGAVNKAVQAENSWRAVKELGYKYDYFTFYLSLTNKPLGWTMGSGIDIHKWIGKLPKPKAGWTPGKYKYMGPYNPLEKQLSYNPETGEVTEWKVKPYNNVDEIAAYHDICYDMGRPKGDCDREMVQSLDSMPYGEMPKWGSTARFLINTKQKLGLGLPAKNVRRR